MGTIKRIDNNNRSNDFHLFMQGDHLVFKRNNLDIDSFTQMENGWSYCEQFFYYGRWCQYSIEGEGSIKKYFPTNGKCLSIKGGFHGFGLKIKVKANNKLPIIIKGTCEGINYCFECRGSRKIAIRDKNGKYTVPMVKGRPKGEEKIALPTNAWNVSHPYQGGGSTPK